VILLASLHKTHLPVHRQPSRRPSRRSCQDISFPVFLMSRLCCFRFSSFSRAELNHNTLQGPLSQVDGSAQWRHATNCYNRVLSKLH
jgi:hypothetical protein